MGSFEYLAHPAVIEQHNTERLAAERRAALFPSSADRQDRVRLLELQQPPREIRMGRWEKRLYESFVHLYWV